MGLNVKNPGFPMVPSPRVCNHNIDDLSPLSPFFTIIFIIMFHHALQELRRGRRHDLLSCQYRVA